MSRPLFARASARCVEVTRVLGFLLSFVEPFTLILANFGNPFNQYSYYIVRTSLRQHRSSVTQTSLDRARMQTRNQHNSFDVPVAAGCEC